MFKLGKATKVYKMDYKELHSVKYGILNSDIWTVKLLTIVDDKINNFDINLNNRSEISGYVSSILDTLIEETQRILHENNSAGEGFFDAIVGSTKQIITDSLIDFKALHQRVPEFTKTVMKEIEKPENQAATKRVLREKLKELMKSNFKLTTDMHLYNAILEKYKSKDLKACTHLLEHKIKTNSENMNLLMMQIVALFVLIVVLIAWQGSLNSIGLWTLTATTLTLLFNGVTLPMIDIEAKIAKLYFVVLEKPIVFENQILFFKSKSIMDLLSLLMHSSELKMVFVGLLLVTFSVIFPLLKLLAISVYYYSLGTIRNHPIVRFFALYSSKWSMADVMVVSIFMAYLGLDGVLGSELSKLEKPTEAVNIITSNGTHLEVGFFLFLAFVASSFILSLLVERHRQKQ